VQIAEDLLKGEASHSLGAGYSLVGNLVTTVTQATVEKNETVSLLVKAEGVWVYQFSDAQKKTLAKLIAGKSQKDAKALLQKQTGVSKAYIQLSQSGGDTLPTNPGQITIVTQSVPGVQGTPTPTPSPVTGLGGN
jgi:VCBS repeat-containing protein